MGTSCEDDMTKPLITQKALIVVRTYPVPAMRGVEVSCTAAITDEGKWLRFHPVPYRFLDPDQRFRKYQWVQVRISKGSDPRPKSYKLSPGSLQVLSRPLPSSENWRQRKNVVLPLRSPSLCALRRAHDENGSPTLGLFRPRTIRRLLIEPDDPSWSDAQLAALRQGSLFDEGEPKIELEKVPFRFRYEFQCEDPGCHTWHRLILHGLGDGPGLEKVARQVRKRLGEEVPAAVRNRDDDQVRHPLLRRDGLQPSRHVDHRRPLLSASRERATLAGVLRLPLPIVAAVRRHPTCWAPGAPSRSLRNVASLGCHPSRRHLTVSSILRKPRSICEPSPISIRIRSISP